MKNELWERLQALRIREDLAGFSQAERDELAILLRQADVVEHQQLHDATQNMRMERQNVEAQNQVLHNLVQRKERLKTHLQKLLKEAQAERRAIDAEVKRVLDHSSPGISGSVSR